MYIWEGLWLFRSGVKEERGTRIVLTKGSRLKLFGYTHGVERI